MEFQTRADQVDYVMRRFINFLSLELEKAGIHGLGESVQRVKDAPGLALIGKAVEIEKKYGEGLRKKDLTTVFRIIIDNVSDSPDCDTLSKTGTRFVEFLEHNPEEKDKVFIYVKVILDLLSE